jgi:hypothetical protein
MAFDLVNLILWIVIMAIIALPVNIAVRSLGGKSTLLKVMIVHFIFGILVYILQSIIGSFSGIFLFLLLIFVYKYSFRMGWIGAMLAYFISLLIVVVFILILAFAGVLLFF